MKTKTKNLVTFIAMLAFAFCMILSFGLLRLTAKADGTETFAVVEGASIREGVVDPNDETKKNNGIRFVSDISKDEYETLTAGKTVETGTFIMAADYVSAYGDLNEANCFGTNAVYTWADKEPAGGTTTILHLPGKANQVTKEDGTEVYRIQGSVINIKEQNLDREYVGVGYIKVTDGTTTSYHFAEGYKTNTRSPIEVAQNALIENEVAKDVEIATDYVDQYLAYYKSVNNKDLKLDLTTNIYVSSSTGEYQRSASRSDTQSITIDSADDLTKVYGVEDLGLSENGYYYIPEKSNATASTTLKFDNTASVSYYYDEQSVDVLFDGATGAQSVEGGAVTGFKQAWGYTNVQPNSYHGIKSKALGIYDHTALSSSNVIITFDETKMLTAPTTDFSFMTKVVEDSKYTGEHVTELPIQIWIYTTASAYQLADLTSIQFNSEGDTEPGEGWASNWQQVNFSLPNAIDRVYQIYMTFTRTANDVAYAFDFFCAEHTLAGLDLGSVSVGGNNVTVSGSDIKLNGDAPVTLTVEGGSTDASELISTVYNSDELATFTTGGVSVTAKKFVHGDYFSVGGTGEAPELTGNVADGYSLNAVENYFTVSAEYSYEINGETARETVGKYMVWGYFPNMIEDFDSDFTKSTAYVSSTNWTWYSSYGVDGGGVAWNGNNSGGRLSFDYSQEGATQKSLTKDCTTVSMWFQPYYFRLGDTNHPSGVYDWPYGLVNIFGAEGSNVEMISAEGYDYIYVEYTLNRTLSSGVQENQELALIGPPTGTHGGVLFGNYYDKIALK